MTEHSKITPAHLARQAIVYIRQSTTAQVEHNRESTERQYQLRPSPRSSAGQRDKRACSTRILAPPERA